MPAADNALILLFFAAFLLAPLKEIAYRAQPFHRLTMVVLGLSAVMLLLLGTTRPDTSGRLLWLSLIGPIYYLGMLDYLTSLLRTTPAAAGRIRLTRALLFLKTAFLGGQ